MGVVKHWRSLFSPTIVLLYDVTRGSPDDEFQESFMMQIKDGDTTAWNCSV